MANFEVTATVYDDQKSDLIELTLPVPPTFTLNGYLDEIGRFGIIHWLDEAGGRYYPPHHVSSVSFRRLDESTG